MKSFKIKHLPVYIASVPLFLGATLAHSASFTDYAKVTDVTPRYETVENRVPYEQCWTEEVVEHRSRSKTPTILGAVIGGALGNELGHHKRNKQVGAVVGAVLGASIGKDISRNQPGRYTQYRDVERCETYYEIESQERLAGYDVEYVYQGQYYTTRMSEDPGKRLKVRVAVKPVL